MIQSAYHISPYTREQHIIDELVSRVRAHELPQNLPSESVALDLESSVDTDDVYATETSIRLYKPRTTSDTNMSALQNATTMLLQDISCYWNRALTHASHVWNALVTQYEEYVAAREAATQPTHLDSAHTEEGDVFEHSTIIWKLQITQESEIHEIPVRIAPKTHKPDEQSMDGNTSILLLTLRIVFARICNIYTI